MVDSTGADRLCYWAETRTDLCDTLFEHFSSYESGVTTKGHVITGILLGSQSTSLDHATPDGATITTHLGPFRSYTGADNPRFDAAMTAASAAVPVLIVVGDEYHALPRQVDLPTALRHRYIVLGFYRITRVWVERVNANEDAMIRIQLDWIASQGKTVWTSLNLPLRTSSSAPVQTLAPSSATSSSTVLPSAQTPSFRVDPAFAQKVPDPSLKVRYFEDDPCLLTDCGEGGLRGLACRICGALNARRCWDRVKCAGCRRLVLAPARPYYASQFSAHSTCYRLLLSPQVRLSVQTLDRFEVSTYSLGRGSKVVRIRPEDLSFADTAFAAFQLPESLRRLRRARVRRARLPGLLTAHFAYNLGEEYDYGVDVESYPLAPAQEGSFASVGGSGRAVLNYLEETISSILGVSCAYNEALVIAYRWQPHISAL